MFIEEGEVAYTYINGKKVPVVKCETEVVLRNKETNYEYNSDQEAEDDIANPNTATQREHVTRSLKVKVAAMPPLGAASDEDKEEYDVSNQKQINRAVTLIVEQLNSTFLDEIKQEQERFSWFIGG